MVGGEGGVGGSGGGMASDGIRGNISQYAEPPYGEPGTRYHWNATEELHGT